MFAVNLCERKREGNARTRLDYCATSTPTSQIGLDKTIGFLTLVNYYIVLDTRQRGHTMVQRWCFQSIRQLPRGAAARYPGRFKDSFSLSFSQSTVLFSSLFFF